MPPLSIIVDEMTRENNGSPVDPKVWPLNQDVFSAVGLPSVGSSAVPELPRCIQLNVEGKAQRFGV